MTKKSLSLSLSFVGGGGGGGGVDPPPNKKNKKFCGVPFFSSLDEKRKKQGGKMEF